MPKLKLTTTNSLLPWLCFNIPAAAISAPPRAIAGTTIKLIMCNGQVRTFHRPFPVSDLMSEYPSHLVCRSDSFFIGQKVPALDSSDTLDLGNSYFLLPSKFFHSAVSLVSIAASFSPSDRTRLLKMVEVQRTPSGKLRIRVSDEFLEKADAVEKGRVCTTAALERDYKGMVKKRGESSWKPKLETIKEVSEKRKDKKKKKDKVIESIDKKKKKAEDRRDDKSPLQDQECNDNCHSPRNIPPSPPPPPPPPPPHLKKSSKRKTKEEKKKKKVEESVQTKEMDHSPESPPPPPPPPPPLRFAGMNVINRYKKKRRDKKEDEKNR